MRTVADPKVLQSLKQRLGLLRPDSTRRWGTLTSIPLGLFGTMSLGDWQRWAYRHTDYHLRQFGL